MNLTRAELLALLAMAFAVFMDGLDSSIVNIALPSIAESFGADANAVAWVAVTYFMMIAGMMLTFGRIADMGHIRRIFIIGFGLFAASSLLCGLSWNLEILIFARTVQGIAAAMLGAVAPMVCVKFLPPTKLGLGMSVLMLSGAVGFCSGPAVGGVLIDVLSWHWAFFINIPIGIFAILFAFRALPDETPVKGAKLDLTGCALLFVAIVCAVYIVEMFAKDGQATICMVLGVIAIVSLVLFVRAEKKAAYPMLNVSMFRDWRLDSAMLTYFLTSIAYVGIAYLIPFYLIKELEMSYTLAGFIVLIPSIFTIIISIPAGHYGDTHGRRNLSIICTVSMLASAVGYALIRPDMGWLPFIPIGLLCGIFWGSCGASLASRIVDLSPEKEKGMASTISNFLYYVGGSFGTALFATMVSYGSGSIGVPVDLISPEDFMDGYMLCMYVGIILSVVAIITAIIIDERKIKSA